jgi:hypothetical protein
MPPAKNHCNRRLAQGVWNYRFSIADCSRSARLMHMGRSCHTTFSIVNRQSAIGDENLAGMHGSGPCYNEYGPSQIPINRYVNL